MFYWVLRTVEFISSETKKIKSKFPTLIWVHIIDSLPNWFLYDVSNNTIKSSVMKFILCNCVLHPILNAVKTGKRKIIVNYFSVWEFLISNHLIQTIFFFLQSWAKEWITTALLHVTCCLVFNTLKWISRKTNI